MMAVSCQNMKEWIDVMYMYLFVQVFGFKKGMNWNGISTPNFVRSHSDSSLIWFMIKVICLGTQINLYT
jgi:hypothetical protein